MRYFWRLFSFLGVLVSPMDGLGQECPISLSPYPNIEGIWVRSWDWNLQIPVKGECLDCDRTTFGSGDCSYVNLESNRVGATADGYHVFQWCGTWLYTQLNTRKVTLGLTDTLTIERVVEDGQTYFDYTLKQYYTPVSNEDTTLTALDFPSVFRGYKGYMEELTQDMDNRTWNFWDVEEKACSPPPISYSLVHTDGRSIDWANAENIDWSTIELRWDRTFEEWHLNGCEAIDASPENSWGQRSLRLSRNKYLEIWGWIYERYIEPAPPAKLATPDLEAAMVNIETAIEERSWGHIKATFAE